MHRVFLNLTAINLTISLCWSRSSGYLEKLPAVGSVLLFLASVSRHVRSSHVRVVQPQARPQAVAVANGDCFRWYPSADGPSSFWSICCWLLWHLALG